MAEPSPTTDSTHPPEYLLPLARSLDAVGALIGSVRADQWSDPTPCTEWDVRRLVGHVIGMNLVFAALMADQPAPSRPPDDHIEPDPPGAYRASSAALLLAFGEPGAMDRQYPGPRETISGADRLQIRLYDLLAHGWDLAQATSQRFEPSDDIVEPTLAFARQQMAGQSRAGRFGDEQEADASAPAIDRLVAFLGRKGPAARVGA